ncbi:auxilin-like protein, partial [Trifolium medium]|nr:auxilin-like protein [Trifolium medium]
LSPLTGYTSTCSSRVSSYYLRRAGISVKKEAPANFLTDLQKRRSTLQPVDVLVHG